jgi:beta-N-acetylhexosaminidase
VITVDQEGGRVQRLRGLHWMDWPAPLDQAQAGLRAMWLRYHLIGQELRNVGIDSNCAPTLDVAQADTHPFLRNRCFGTDPARVAELGRAAADGMLAAGVLPIMKHMPGHGRAIADSHHGLPTVTASQAELERLDFAPFRALADLPMGMTAHIRFTDLDDAPATASSRMVGIIRDSISFDGLLMTDDITMNALSGTQAERAAMSIAAGCDLVLHCNGTIADMQPVVDATGAMSPDTSRRADAALARRHAPQDADLAALMAEWRELTGNPA